jgi:hypothetical protein
MVYWELVAQCVSEAINSTSIPGASLIASIFTAVVNMSAEQDRQQTTGRQEEEERRKFLQIIINNN